MKDYLLAFGLLWLRVLGGLGLMVHGWYKIQGGVEAFAVHGVEPLGFPMPLLFAWLATGAELIGGFFLVLGLWTRWAALILVFNMAVAAFGAGAAAPIIAPGKHPTKELALVYLTIVAALAMTGAGRFSVDAGRGGSKPAPKRSNR